MRESIVTQPAAACLTAPAPRGVRLVPPAGAIARRAALAALAFGAWTLSGCTSTSPPAVAIDPAVRAALAPTGTLRVAVYPGSPTSMIRAADGEMRGLSLDIGRALAERLAVPAEVVVLERAAEVVEAIKAGRADFTITNATPARAKDVDFTPPLVAIELGYAALRDAPVQSLAEVDRPGVRVGVAQGSTSQGVLTRSLQQARVVPVPNLKTAGEMLRRREIDTFATNKAILHELADAVPGAQVLPGRWGLEHLAIAIPKGRASAAAFLRDFAAAARAQGLVQRAAERADLRGLADDS